MDKTATISAVLVGTSAILAASPPGQPPEAYAAALTGAWKGTLEYRDYRSDRRVTLPTMLVVTPTPDGLTFAYTYDDGPGKTVRSTERITIATDRETYRIQNGDGTYDVTFAAAGLGEFGKGSTTVVLAGKGIENERPVDVRITIAVNGGSFSMLRESRLASADWTFRNHYRFDRDAGPGR